MKSQFKAWAIDLNIRPFKFLGRYWWGSIPPQVEGSESCLFKTRKVAREYLKDVRSSPYWKKAKVCKVMITIETID